MVLNKIKEIKLLNSMINHMIIKSLINMDKIDEIGH